MNIGRKSDIERIIDWYRRYDFRIRVVIENDIKVFTLVHENPENEDLNESICIYSDFQSINDALYGFIPAAQNYIKKTNLLPFANPPEVNVNDDNYILYELSKFLDGETLDECPIYIDSRERLFKVTRNEIKYREAQLVRFIFGTDRSSCVAVVYDSGEVFTPTDWQTPIWDNKDWKIEDSQWMNSDFRDCVNFDGLPRIFGV